MSNYADITMDQAILDEVDAEITLAIRGEIVLEEMDAHRVWIRCKVAGILCIWDQRTCVNAEDWDLAGQIVETSAGVLAAASKHVEVLDLAKEEELSDKAARKAEKCSLAVRGAQDKRNKLAIRIAKRIRAEGVPCAESTIKNNFIASRERNLFGAAMSYAAAQSCVERLTSGHWVPGSKAP